MFRRGWLKKGNFMTVLQLQNASSFEGTEVRELACHISVIVPITERHDDLQEIYQQTANMLGRLERSVEFIFVVDGQKFAPAFEQLCEMQKAHSELRVILLSKTFGEATALAVGFEQARGQIIITLSPYFQVEPVELLKMIARLEAGVDLVISRRYPRIDSVFNRAQSYVFHWLIRRLTGITYHDLGCGMRVMRKEVAKELELYGDLHRFIPLLALRLGFKVEEVEVRQSQQDTGLRVAGIGIYVRRFLDILTVFFITKFTKKPLRFFGLIAVFIFMAGLLPCIYLSLLKIIASAQLYDRPMLILGVLLMTIGVQIGSIGLIGELIIFTHARQMNDYRIEKILE
jgi:glycosyltransferase involved in cell wall biosynthesis